MLFWGIVFARSEWRVGVEVGRGLIGGELSAPGVLDLRAVAAPELVAHELDALEDSQGLRGRPMRVQRKLSACPARWADA